MILADDLGWNDLSWRGGGVADELGPPAWPAIVDAVIPVDRTLADPPVDGEEYIYWPN